MNESSARIIAYYLPQYHPIPENDEWWGKGFTEWTNVAKAKPLFKGHWQPRLPADLGFYDLRVPEVRQAQADMAAEYGIEGFCYYHYWFGEGKMLLELPFNEVLSSGEPDFPFCLCWANETWKGIWFGETDKILIEQKKPDRGDLEKHFEYLLPAFNDKRYMRVDEKPIFQILTPGNIPNSLEVTDILRELAHKSGLKGLFLVAGYRCPDEWDPRKFGFDGVVSSRLSSSFKHKSLFRQKIQHFADGGYLSRFVFDLKKLRTKLKRFYHVYDYNDFIEFSKISKDYDFEFFPSVLPNWDNTPRSGVEGYVLKNSAPHLFERHLRDAVSYVQKYDSNHRLIFVKSWNEWAEGNYLEPDREKGFQNLEVIRRVVSERANKSS